MPISFIEHVYQPADQQRVQIIYISRDTPAERLPLAHAAAAAAAAADVAVNAAAEAFSSSVGGIRGSRLLASVTTCR